MDAAGSSPAEKPNILAVIAAYAELRELELAADGPDEMLMFSLMFDYVDLGSEGADARMLELVEGSDAALDALTRLEAGVLPSPSEWRRAQHPASRTPAPEPCEPRRRGPRAPAGRGTADDADIPRIRVGGVRG